MDKLLKKIVWFVIATPVVYLAIVWDSLPAIVPLHYDLSGEVNRYGSKDELFLVAAILTIVNIGEYLLLINVHRIDPKKNASVNKSRMLRMGFMISVFISTLFCIIIYTCGHQSTKFSIRLIMALIGLLYCFIGNYMFNIKPNYFAGIRLPWTLENEENWRKTHLLAGKLFFFGGLLLTIVSLAVPATTIATIFIIITVIITLIPCVYSYLIYKKQKNLTRSNQ